MKVIKEGKKIVATMRVRCYLCEAELEIEAKDLTHQKSDSSYLYKCPCCGRTNCIEYEELSEDMIIDLNK